MIFERASRLSVITGRAVEVLPIDFAMRMLCAQRQWEDAPAAGSKPTHFVGGFGMVTTVNSQAVSQMKTNDWPNSIGRRIMARPFDLLPIERDTGSPAPAPVPPSSPPPGLSLQQRRAWEVDQRRKGKGQLHAV